MSVLNVTAPAKVNLVLEVLGKRSDGYHEISTIFQEVPELADTIELKKSSAISIKCNNPDTPTDESNSIWRILDILRESLGIKLKFKIDLYKEILPFSGLAGSGSDAAAVLKGLDAELHLGLTRSQKLEILKQIGSDAPFFLDGGLQLGTGRGDKLSTLPSLPPCRIEIIKTGVKINTTEAYDELELTFPREASKTAEMIKGIHELDIDKVAANVHNDFQAQIASKNPAIQEQLDQLKKDGALASLLAGSGGAVFAIY